MPSDSRETVRRNFSINKQASEAIDEFADRHDMTKSKVVENAVLDYVDAKDKVRLEDKVDEILDILESDGPASSDDEPHTHTRAESDGGVSVQTSSAPSPSDDPAKITSFDDYKPELPEDYELTTECLENAPEAVEHGQIINDDHVDYNHLQSRGASVRVKTAVCAGIVRYHNIGDMRAKEEQIKSVAAEVLGGKRNARRHFDEIVSYFYDGPMDHPEVHDTDMVSREAAREMCAQDGLYALTFEALDEPYWRHKATEDIERVRVPLAKEEPENPELVAAYNVLSSLANESEDYIPYLADSVDQLERVYDEHRSRIMPMVQAEYENLELPETFADVE